MKKENVDLFFFEQENIYTRICTYLWEPLWQHVTFQLPRRVVPCVLWRRRRLARWAHVAASFASPALWPKVPLEDDRRVSPTAISTAAASRRRISSAPPAAETRRQILVNLNTVLRRKIWFHKNKVFFYQKRYVLFLYFFYLPEY